MKEDNKNDNVDLQKKQAYNIKFINPELIIEKIEIKSGSVVADFGCGAGYFSLPVAKKIGEQGSLYALDILPSSLETINSQAKTMGLTNISTKRVNLEKESGSGLASGSCDWVIIKDILFQNKNKLAILAEARRVLKEHGKVLVIEWNVEDASIGPDKNLRISKNALIELIQESGLGVLNEVVVSDFHYGLILFK